MLKLNRILLMPDGNTGGESSTPPDGKVADSSTAEQGGTNTETSEATPLEVEDDGGESPESATGENETDNQPDGQSEEGGEQEQQEPLEEPTPEKEKFIPRERFDEVNTKAQTYQQEVEQLKPFAQQGRAIQDFLSTNNIPAQDLQNHLQFMQTVRRDPVAAFKIIKPIYDQLAQLSGEVLPPELQAEVAAATLSPERATQIAKAEAAQRYAQWQQQQQQFNQQQQVGSVVQGSIGSWQQLKQTSDPDFKPGTPLWELTDKNIRASSQFRTAQEAIDGSEKAYQDAKAFLTKFQPRQQTPAKRPPQSRTTANNSNGMIPSLEKGGTEAVIAALKAGLKPHQMRYT